MIPESDARRRIAGGALLLVGAGMMVWSLVQTLTDMPPWERERVNLHERRFAPLRAELPPRGVVGFVSRIPQRENLPRDAGGQGTEFILAQYAIAPVLLVNDARRDLVVGYLPGEESVAPILSANGLAVVSEHPDGVRLLRRAE